MRADSNHLRNFLAIVDEGSFTRAAKVRNMSQPTLSASIAQLEQALGTQVLNRTKSGAVPNNFGRLLIPHARAVEAALAKAEEQVELWKAGVTGPLAVGGTPVALMSFAPKALNIVVETFGQLSATVSELGDEHLIPMLRTDLLDVALGVVELNAPEPDIVEEVLARVPYDVVVSSKHPLATREKVDLAEVADLTWAMPAKGGAFRKQIESLFVATGLPFPAAVIECSTLAILKEVVLQTECVSILPHPAAELEVKSKLLSIISLTNPRPPRAFGFMVRRDRTLPPHVAVFVDALRTVARMRQFPYEQHDDQ